MPLRKSPTRTPALLAALRANSRKSTGPRTPCGKARVALNALKHGRRAERLPEKLLRAGDREGEALYRWFRAEITAAFGRGRANEERRCDQIAAAAWCWARGLRRLRATPECPLVSWALGSRAHELSRIQIVDLRRRIGLTFWVQRPRYWTRRRWARVRMGKEPFGILGRGSSLEQRWRRLRFRTHQPSPWEEWILTHEASKWVGPAAGERPAKSHARTHAGPTTHARSASGAERRLGAWVCGSGG